MSNRTFVLPLDESEPAREFTDRETDASFLDEGNVVSVRLIGDKVEVSLEGSYDTFELVVNMPVERAVALFRALLVADRELPET